MVIELWNGFNGITIDSELFSFYIGTPVLIGVAVFAIGVAVLRRVRKARGL